MIRRPPRSTQSRSSAASDVYKRQFLAGATRSELMVIMTSGMAHVSGGIMAAYISFGINAQDLLSAVIMTAPGTILVAKMLVPETEIPATAGTVHMPPNEEHKNCLLYTSDAADDL